ncbi:hypothetical protein F4808DRAFT_150234 [Astrocystis sublimbata]|nr:hypothetical protein F4808DRAFT_150234 [Astrocystis sublimbata]
MSSKSVLGAICARTSRTSLLAAHHHQQLRSFTSTLPRSANITHFSATSSPELDALLSEIRTKIILPSYLPEAQRQRIYSRKWEKKLQHDPVIIEIDGEVLKFRYQNPLTTIPSTRLSLISAVRLFNTDADFANLKPLLEGIAHAGRHLKVALFAQLIRIVGKKGHIYDIIDCARSVKHTGFRLNTHEVVNELLHFVQMKAVDADWDEAQTRTALRWADMVIEILHDEAHQPMQPLIPGELPLARDPFVLAAPLHLSAALATKHDSTDEVLEKLHKSAWDLVTVWPEGKNLREVQPAELFINSRGLKYLQNHNKFLYLATPLLHGLEMAAKVVKPELAEQLQTRRDGLADEIREARKCVEDWYLELKRTAEAGQEILEPRGQLLYKKFYSAA